MTRHGLEFGVWGMGLRLDWGPTANRFTLWDLQQSPTPFGDLKETPSTFGDLQQNLTTSGDLQQTSTTFGDLQQSPATFRDLQGNPRKTARAVLEDGAFAVNPPPSTLNPHP